MAHQIRENDYMFSASGIRPWHGLGAIVDNALTTAEAIQTAKLDWKVEKLPMVAVANQGKRNEARFKSEFQGLVRMDTQYTMGIVKDRYEIVQNIDAFNFVDEIMALEKGAVRYETAGSLYNGKKIFLLVKMPEVNLLGDDIENYLFFTNSHDGLNSVRAGISNVRVVCDNTLQMALKGATRSWSAPHTKTIKQKQQEAAHSLKLASAYLKELPLVADKMATQKVNVAKVVPTFFTAAELEKESVKEMVSKIILIATNKPDLANFKGSAWGVYNAVADFVSHDGFKTFKSNDRKMETFLKGYSLLGKAQAVLQAA